MAAVRTFVPVIVSVPLGESLMSHIQSAQIKSDPHVSLDRIRPTSAKADLHQSDSVRLPDEVGHAFAEVVYDALVDHFTSLKNLTLELGETDPSFVKRELLAGKFQRLRALKPDAIDAAATALKLAFGALQSPEDRARELVREMRRKCDEFEQYIGYRQSA